VRGEPFKPKRASLPKGLKPEDLSLEAALGLLRCPGLLGEHPDGGKVQAGLVCRFGPYIVHDKAKARRITLAQGRSTTCSLVGPLPGRSRMPRHSKKGRGGRTALKDLGSPGGEGESIGSVRRPLRAM